MVINDLQMYSIGGTQNIDKVILNKEDVLIAIESVSMFSGLILEHQPKPRQGPQPEVLESLRRSIDTNADVWSELSKY